MRDIALYAAGILVIALLLGTIKVGNELKMTKAYERQADALERIASASERAHPVPLALRPAETIRYGAGR